MKFDKKQVIRLNDLLIKVKENRNDVIDFIKELCPGKIKECDNQLELSREAVNCKYFTLCNVLGSYSLLSNKEQQRVNKLLDQVYVEIGNRRNKFNDIYR